MNTLRHSHILRDQADTPSAGAAQTEVIGIDWGAEPALVVRQRRGWNAIMAATRPSAQDARAGRGRGVNSGRAASAGNSPTRFTPHDPGPPLNFSARLIPRFPHRFVENFGGERLEAAP